MDDDSYRMLTFEINKGFNYKFHKIMLYTDKYQLVSASQPSSECLPVPLYLLPCIEKQVFTLCHCPFC